MGNGAPQPAAISRRRNESRSAMKKKPAKNPAAKKKTAQLTPAGMEKMMRELVARLEGEDGVVTSDDLNALLSSFGGPSANDRLSDRETDAKDEAQQIAFEAMDAESEAQARKLAKRALKLDPDCVDALVVMVDLDARTRREMIVGLQKAVEAGERSLGAKFIRENKGHFWMLLETRPYMRALELLARALSNAGINADAIRIYEKMLELNPNDNQGVRDPLLGLYLAVSDLAGAGRLLKKYKEDSMANFAWGRVLERLLAADRAGAQAALKKARAANPFVELYLTARKPLPEDPPEMYSPGSEEEAVLCLNNLGVAWAEHKEAAFWLFDQLEADGAGLAAGKEALMKAPVTGKRVQ
jgi:tetratricopeptide (TPR) repeat protein